MIMDLGGIITSVIVFCLTTVFGYVWVKHIRPWLEDRHLTEVAEIVVKAAEAAYGAGRGDEKLAYAIKMLDEKYKISMDADKIVAAINAAWQTMNTTQIISGEKKLEEE